MRWIFRNSKLGAVLAVAVLILWPSFSQAQSAKVRDWNNQQDLMQSAIGLHYGQLAGHGLSFRFPLTWYLYAQVGGGIWHTSEDEKHNLGFELNYILRQDDKLRLFLGAGAGYFYHREMVDNSGDSEIWNKSQDWNVGAGVGIEYLLGVRWAVQGELDFVHTGENGDIKVAPQVGIHYYW
jgi:hypothetical protein